MNNKKLNVYKKVLQEVMFNLAEQFIKERVARNKLSAEEVTYLFTNNEYLQVLLKFYIHHLECSVISLIFFALCLH